MKKKRLLKLAKLLREDAANKKGARFDLCRWAAPAYTDFFPEEPTELPKIDCNTSACAMGLAVLSGAFKRAGLGALYYERSSGIAMEPVINDKDGREHSGFDAAQVLFGITFHEANYLFGPVFYPLGKRKEATGERYVAKRIECFVEEGGIPQRDLDPRYTYRAKEY
jgi:hypothetical protein